MNASLRTVRESLRRNDFARPSTLLALLIVAVVLSWTVAPGLFTGFDPIETAPGDKLLPPSTDHWFGTDWLGRDLYSRVVHGTRLSLIGALVAVALAFVIGTTVGLTAGFFGGMLDAVLMRVIDVLLSVPGLLVSLMVITALGFGTVNVAIAVGVAGIAGFARVMRAQVLRVRQELFVEAAFIGGARWWQILVRHILPNSSAPVVALLTLELGTAVLSIAALSFLGYGAPPPAPEWGAIVAGSRDYIVIAWWLTTFPSAVIAASVISINRISRAVNGGRRARRR